jgi:hypothetical protein
MVGVGNLLGRAERDEKIPIRATRKFSLNIRFPAPYQQLSCRLEGETFDPK